MTYYMPMPYLPDDLKSIRYLFEYGMIAPHLMAHFEAFKKIIMKVTFFSSAPATADVNWSLF